MKVCAPLLADTGGQVHQRNDCAEIQSTTTEVWLLFTIRIRPYWTTWRTCDFDFLASSNRSLLQKNALQCYDLRQCSVVLFVTPLSSSLAS